jgi:hypothetical protein
MVTKKKAAAPRMLAAPAAQSPNAWQRDCIPVAEVARDMARANAATTDDFEQTIGWLHAMQTIEHDPDVRVIDEHSGRIVAGTEMRPKEPAQYSMTRDEADLFMRRHGFAETEPHFEVPVCPREVPAELEGLPDDKMVRYVDFWGGSGACAAKELARRTRETIARQLDGWYTLDEAAQMLEDAGRGNAREQWAKKLEKAARSGLLPMHEPGTLARMVYDDARERVRSFYELANTADLNCWLEQHEPRLPYRFDAPTSTVHASRDRWTPERLSELKRVRERDGTKAAAGSFGISAARVRQLLPRPPRKPAANDPFGRTTKR